MMSPIDSVQQSTLFWCKASFCRKKMTILSPHLLEPFDSWKQAVACLVAENRSYLGSPWTEFESMGYIVLHKGRHKKDGTMSKIRGGWKNNKSIQMSIWQFWKTRGWSKFFNFSNWKEISYPILKRTLTLAFLRCWVKGIFWHQYDLNFKNVWIFTIIPVIYTLAEVYILQVEKQTWK